MCIYTLLRRHCYLHIHYNVYADKNAESLLSGNEVLSFILDSNMTKATFQLHGNVAIAKQYNLYLSYSYKIIKTFLLS